MKHLTLTRDGYQRYTGFIKNVGRIEIERSGNPTCAPCFRWTARSTGDCGAKYTEHAFTLRDIRRKLAALNGE